ncbi:mannosyltransferase putative-domain-containing protein [Choanephora cucurbitarum]|nr:mannosyltransferase putative-domain-containing protein [Choanephora cucurbitarum]
MKAQVNSRLVRLISVILVVFFLCYLFRYLLDLEQQNTLRKEQEEEAARLALKKVKDQERQLLLEQALEKERQRQQRILENRSVIEPNMTDLKENHPELFEKYYIAVPTQIEHWRDETMELLNSPLGYQLASDLLTIPEEKPKFKSLTAQERTFKSLYQYFDLIIAEGKVNVETDPAYRDSWKLYEQLEEILYPWIRPYWKNVFEINKRHSSGRGIVMCVGNGQFKHAASSVQAIRNILKSDMPIEIFYINEWDLSEEKRAYFESIPYVSTVDISTRIDDDYTQLGGWAIKAFAMLASSFSEVTLMDADVFMFKKPESFFEDPGYKATGALFFLDRTLFDNYDEGRIWIKSFLPTFSSYVKESRWWKTTSAHEQESGIVVMNKKKVLLGLLSTCKMNDKQERDKVSYKHVHGDKETFWIGFEMVQTPYAFVRSYGAVIGGLGDEGADGTVCGNQLHLDTNDNRPWWWNGGLLRDKNRWDDRYLRFTHFAEGENWEFESSCINDKDKIRQLNSREKGIGEQLIAMDKERKAQQAGGNLAEDDE